MLPGSETNNYSCSYLYTTTLIIYGFCYLVYGYVYALDYYLLHV